MHFINLSCEKLINSYAKYKIGVRKMNAKIQFGDKWVQVKGSIFYLPPHVLEILKAWYDWSVKHDTEASEEFRAEEVEYFAKAFEMLKPESDDEALRYLTILEDAFVTDYKIKEIIDRIHANKSGLVREL